MKNTFSLATLVKRVHALPSWSILLLLGLLLLGALVLGVSFGATAIPLDTILQVLLNSTGIFHFARLWDPATEVIIWQYRFPIVVGTALVGAALAVAGALFQAILRNPLADPFLIGTSSGAALGAAIAFILPFDTVYGAFFPLTSLCAFAGALVTVLFVYLLARSGGETPVVTLILAGVVVNAVLDAFGLGEESAAHLGLHVERYKLLIIVLASLITAAAVSISGLIGFVGLMIPHVMRLLLGPRHRVLLPAAAFGGAIFLVLADLLARVVLAPSVLPVGIFTSLIGAPFFLFLLKNSKRAYKW